MVINFSPHQSHQIEVKINFNSDFLFQNKFGESDKHIDNTVDNTLEKLELIHSLVDTGGSKDTCCTLPTFRSCPSIHTPRSQRCEQDTRGQTCSDLQLDCIRCNCDYSCQYGKPRYLIWETMTGNMGNQSREYGKARQEIRKSNAGNT